MTIYSMFPLINVPVMNVHVDNVYIREENNNSLEENVTLPIIIPFPKIYPMLVPKIIINANTSNFITVFFDVVHV